MVAKSITMSGLFTTRSKNGTTHDCAMQTATIASYDNLNSDVDSRARSSNDQNTLSCTDNGKANPNNQKTEKYGSKQSE